MRVGALKPFDYCFRDSYSLGVSNSNQCCHFTSNYDRCNYKTITSSREVRIKTLHEPKQRLMKRRKEGKGSVTVKKQTFLFTTNLMPLVLSINISRFIEISYWSDRPYIGYSDRFELRRVKWRKECLR